LAPFLVSLSIMNLFITIKKEGFIPLSLDRLSIIF